jgi:hypothetical protein
MQSPRNIEIKVRGSVLKEGIISGCDKKWE